MGGGAVCRLLRLCEVREGLEWNLLWGDEGREVREDTHRATGRRESPEAVNPAG